MSDTITHDANGHATSFTGPKAVEVFRIATMITALGLLSKGMSPTRGYTLTRGLKDAESLTGKKYKRTEIEQARTDLKEVLDRKKMEIAHVNTAT